MPCKVHTGKRGGKFKMERKKGGGVKKVYLIPRYKKSRSHKSRVPHARKRRTIYYKE